MATVKATRGAQNALHSEFIINLGADSMVDTSGALKAFKAAAGIFDIIGLPMNAVVIGGDMTVETVSNESGTSTMKIGDVDSDARYLGATNLKAAARTALVPTGYRGVGKNLRITLANQNGDATAGKVSVRVSYIVTGRVTEQHAPI